MIKDIMNQEFLNQLKKPDAITTEKFEHLNDFFVIDIPCLFSIDKKVYSGDIYDLLDFKDNGNIIERAVKFFYAYLRGYKVIITVLDMDSGEMLTRNYRLNSNLPCDWVLIEYGYLNPEVSDEQAIQDYCKSKPPQHDN